METSLTCRSCRSCRWRWRWRCCRCLFIPLFLPLSPFPRFFTRNPKPAEAMACKGTQQERCSISLPLLPSFLPSFIHAFFHSPFLLFSVLLHHSPSSFFLFSFIHSFFFSSLSLSPTDRFKSLMNSTFSAEIVAVDQQISLVDLVSRSRCTGFPFLVPKRCLRITEASLVSWNYSLTRLSLVSGKIKSSLVLLKNVSAKVSLHVLFGKPKCSLASLFLLISSRIR